MHIYLSHSYFPPSLSLSLTHPLTHWRLQWSTASSFCMKIGDSGSVWDAKQTSNFDGDDDSLSYRRDLKWMAKRNNIDDDDDMQNADNKGSDAERGPCTNDHSMMYFILAFTLSPSSHRCVRCSCAAFRLTPNEL